MVIESECGVHDNTNTETCYLIRDIDLGVSNFNGWYGRKSAEALMSAEKYSFRLVWVKTEAIKQSQDRKAAKHASIFNK